MDMDFHWQNRILILSGVRLSLLDTAATTGLLYQPQMIDDGDCGAIGGMRIDRGNPSTQRKPASAPLCPPQIPHDQTWTLTQVAVVESQRLTTWAMARPQNTISHPTILLHVRGSVIINNGFWIGWLDLLTLLLQSFLITINYSAIANISTSQITRTHYPSPGNWFITGTITSNHY
jgi:hypothetical protein